MTKTFALIDNASGYVWGVTTAADPIEACRKVDEDFHEHGRTYEEVGYFDGDEGGYHVYEVPAGFDVDDGSTQKGIDAVERHDRVARVTFTRGDE